MKVPFKQEFSSFEENVYDPKFSNIDNTNCYLQHQILISLMEFCRVHKCYPYDDSHQDPLTAIFQEIGHKLVHKNSKF